ncbi:MAG: hypothetical protein M1840_007888 [Geoglossum simile]|nr:MAG: hypothetical protein M1840_007888 [Geoglossum simile]
MAHNQASLSVAATGLLWIRSFSEIVIVVRYHLRRHPAPTNTPVARDTIYGLCTVTFLILITNIVDGMTKEHARNPLLAKIEEDTRNSIISKIEAELSRRNPAPTLAGVFEAIKQDPDSVLSDHTRQAVYGGDPDQRDILRERHRDYLDRLEEKYGRYVSEDRSRET